MEKGDYLAFPFNDGQPAEWNQGMSKREYMATKAMEGLCRNDKDSYFPYTDIAKKAVEYADALIAALNK